MSEISDAIALAREIVDGDIEEWTPGHVEAVRVLADVAERALIVDRHADVSTPFTHGMRCAAKIILGRIPAPPEWLDR